MKYKNSKCPKINTCCKECALDHGCFPEFIDIVEKPDGGILLNIQDDKFKEIFKNKEDFYEFYETVPYSVIRLRKERIGF